MPLTLNKLCVGISRHWGEMGMKGMNHLMRMTLCFAEEAELIFSGGCFSFICLIVPVSVCNRLPLHLLLLDVAVGGL